MNFEELYAANADLVFNLSFTYVKNKQDAQEVTQDVFLKLHQKQDSFKGESELKTWVYRICINTSLDFIKARKRKKRTPLNSVISTDNLQVSGNGDPESDLVAKEAYLFLLEALDQIPDNQKTALILAKLESRSNIEVAEIMNLSRASVDALLFRGKKNLEKMLGSRKNV